MKYLVLLCLMFTGCHAPNSHIVCYSAETKILDKNVLGYIHKDGVTFWWYEEHNMFQVSGNCIVTIGD